jgi:hypothetical protein
LLVDLVPFFLYRTESGTCDEVRVGFALMEWSTTHPRRSINLYLPLEWAIALGKKSTGFASMVSTPNAKRHRASPKDPKIPVYCTKKMCVESRKVRRERLVARAKPKARLPIHLPPRLRAREREFIIFLKTRLSHTHSVYRYQASIHTLSIPVPS